MPLLTITEEELKIMIIYKVINLVNGKIYVGKSTKNHPEYFGSGWLIKRALKKYGRENFRKEIIEICTTEEELNEKEIFWINKLNSRNPKIGYNLHSGGSGNSSLGVLGNKNPMFGKHHSELTKKKIRAIHKGKSYEQKFGIEKALFLRQKISASKKGKPSKAKGKPLNLTVEGRKKKSETCRKTHLGVPKSAAHRKKLSLGKLKNKIKQIDLQTGEIVAVWYSLLKTIEILKVDGSTIKACCKGQLKTAYHYRWEFCSVDSKEFCSITIEEFEKKRNLPKLGGTVKGSKLSEATKIKISKKNKGKATWNKGIPRTEVEKKNIREGIKKQKNLNY